MVNVYCDMEGTNCNGEGGWTRVAFVNMSEPGATCPTGLTQIEQSNLTLCSREDDNRLQSAFFKTLHSYSAVCGRVRGYQFGQTQAFITYQATIDNVYAEGVSITHGTNPRKHIWTYVAGSVDNEIGSGICLCNNGSIASTPSFVDENYYCESGTDNFQNKLHPNDPLWDGMQCNNLEGPCCKNSNLPWFNTALSERTNDNIELRLLFDTRIRPIGGTPLDLIELYIR